MWLNGSPARLTVFDVAHWLGIDLGALHTTLRKERRRSA
jgi:hypothetical protein